MAKWIFRLLYSAICIGLGWALGATYRAPPIVIQTTDNLVLATRDSIAEALEARKNNAKQLSTLDGPAGLTEPTITEPAPIRPKIDKPKAKDTAPAPEAPASETPAPEAKKKVKKEVVANKKQGGAKASELAPFVMLCPRMTVSNAPSTNKEEHIKKYKPLKKVGGIDMAMMPVHDACLSSGFGTRRGKLHKGVDYHHKVGGTIFAAADGQIIEAEYRDDYGFMVLINHGNKYYTRYAHLKGFAKGVKAGATIPRGFSLGEMSNTASYKIPIHLHFELLKGDYNTPKKSFGLTAVDIFKL